MMLHPLGFFGVQDPGGGPDGTRRALEISGSTGTAGGMTWAAGTPGYSQFTFSGWVYIPTGHANSETIFAGPSGEVQIFTGAQNAGVISARSSIASGTINSASSAYSLDTWFHLHVRMGTNIGTAGKDVLIFVNGSEVASGTAHALSSTQLNGTWYLLEDDGSDLDFSGRLFDVGLFGTDLSEANRNQSGTDWVNFGSTAGIVCRMDGQVSADATYDSSGNANHWTQASGGGSVVTSATSLPSGANP